jgi:hypothetical protein
VNPENSERDPFLLMFAGTVSRCTAVNLERPRKRVSERRSRERTTLIGFDSALVELRRL